MCEMNIVLCHLTILQHRVCSCKFYIVWIDVVNQKSRLCTILDTHNTGNGPLTLEIFKLKILTHQNLKWRFKSSIKSIGKIVKSKVFRHQTSVLNFDFRGTVSALVTFLPIIVTDRCRVKTQRFLSFTFYNQ